MRVIFLKRTVVSILYFMTALTACFFALLLVLNFVNPALSQDNPVVQTNEKPGFKDIFKDIVQNLKTILSDSMGENTDSESGSSSQEPVPSEDQVPAVPQPEGLPLEDQVPAVPQPEGLPLEDQVPAVPQPEGLPLEDQVPAVPQPEGLPLEDQVPAVPQPEGLPLEDQVPAVPQPEGLPSEDQVPAVPQPEGLPLEDQVPSSPQPEGLPLEDQDPAVPQPEDFSTEGQPMHTPQSFVDDLTGIPSEWMLDIQSSIAPFIYEYGKQKDPFDDPTIQEHSAESGVVVIPKTPPEEYDLKEIKLKGIIWDTQTPKALFELPSLAGYYTLIKGDKIGKNGIIFEIREDEVVVVETNYIGRGPDKKEEITIKIKQMDRLNFSGSSKK